MLERHDEKRRTENGTVHGSVFRFPFSSADGA